MKQESQNNRRSFVGGVVLLVALMMLCATPSARAQTRPGDDRMTHEEAIEYLNGLSSNSPNDAGLPRPNATKYAEAKESAEASADAGELDRALEQYEVAWESARRAYALSEFGSDTMTVPIGRGEQLEIPLPEGSEIPKEVARDAAMVAARAERSGAAIKWARRSVGIESGMGLGDAEQLLTRFERQARRRGNHELADRYRLALVRHEIQGSYPRADYIRRKREKLSNILWTLEGLSVLVLLGLVGFEWRRKRSRFVYYPRGDSDPAWLSLRPRYGLLGLAVPLIGAGFFAIGKGAEQLFDAWGWFGTGWALATAGLLSTRAAFALRHSEERDDPVTLTGGPDVDPASGLETTAFFESHAPEVLRDLGVRDLFGRVRCPARVAERLTEIEGRYLRAMLAGWLGEQLVDADEDIPEWLDATLARGLESPARDWEPVCSHYLRALDADRRSRVLDDVDRAEWVTLVPSTELGEDSLPDEDTVADWLETSMARGRRWTVDQWRVRFLEDEAIGALVRGLVWGTYSTTGVLRTTFRADGEGSLVDVDCNTMTPDSFGRNVRLGLAHAVEMGELLCDRWSQHLGEFEEFALFGQFDRVREVPDQGDWLPVSCRMSAEEFARLKNECGWHDHGTALQKHFYGHEITAFAHHFRDGRWNMVESVRFTRNSVMSTGHGTAVSLGSVPDVVLSEIMYELGAPD